MTAKHRKRLQDIFKPKHIWADARYGLHRLDNTAEEIIPGGPTDRGTAAFSSARDESGAPVFQRRREAAADDPELSPAKSDSARRSLMIFPQLNTTHDPATGKEVTVTADQARRIQLVDARRLRTEMGGEDLDLRSFCEQANLTTRQTEVIVLAGEGWTQRAIASWLHISQPTVWHHLHKGRVRLTGWLPDAVLVRLDSTLSAGV